MSDALLTEISGKLSEIAKLLKAGAAPAAAAPKTTAAGAGGNATADAAKVAAAKKAAEDETKKKAAAAAAAKTGAGAKPGTLPATTKAPGGKHTLGQVRDLIRKVAADKSLGTQSAKDILQDDGGGVERCDLVKPENYDKVYEACEVLLNGEGAKEPEASSDEDDLM